MPPRKRAALDLSLANQVECGGAACLKYAKTGSRRSGGGCTLKVAGSSFAARAASGSACALHGRQKARLGRALGGAR